MLISQLIQWQEDRNVSVWLSRLNSFIFNIDSQRVKTKITKMTPVIKENRQTDVQLLLFPVSEPERRLTLQEVCNYLQTADAENAIKVIQ